MKLSLIQQVAEKFNGQIILNDTVNFTVGEDAYCLTDGTLYATLDDGSFLPGFKKVKTLRSVISFVELRS